MVCNSEELFKYKKNLVTHLQRTHKIEKDLVGELMNMAEIVPVVNSRLPESEFWVSLQQLEAPEIIQIKKDVKWMPDESDKLQLQSSNFSYFLEYEGIYELNKIKLLTVVFLLKKTRILIFQILCIL